MSAQSELFTEEQGPLPAGVSYQSEFVSPEEEARLLALIATLPLQAAHYKEFTARREVLSYGGEPGTVSETVPEPLQALRSKVAAWSGWSLAEWQYTLVTRYQSGTPLGWHRDAPEFDVIAGVSLGSPGEMPFRRHPPSCATNKYVSSLWLPPRSAYLLSGEARSAWQHSVPPATGLRCSITFRTRRSSLRGPPAGTGPMITSAK